MHIETWFKYVDLSENEVLYLEIHAWLEVSLSKWLFGDTSHFQTHPCTYQNRIGNIYKYWTCICVHPNIGTFIFWCHLSPEIWHDIIFQPHSLDSIVLYLNFQEGAFLIGGFNHLKHLGHLGLSSAAEIEDVKKKSWNHPSYGDLAIFNHTIHMCFHYFPLFAA